MFRGIISSICLSVLIIQPVMGHEYWLQPEQYFLNDKEMILAHVRVGEHFKGETHAYIPNHVASVRLHVGSETRDLSPRFGDIPAVRVTAPEKGLNILTIETTPYWIEYTDPENFRKFLDYDGLEWVLDAHKKRGLPDSGFTEAYLRHAKSLIHVGDGKGRDRNTGMAFEWVMLTNPYTDKGDELSVQLWWQGKGFANAPYRVFIQKDGKASEVQYKTDASGIGSFPRQSNALYMINAVHMILPDKKLEKSMKAVWQSHWATLSFATP